MYCIWQIHPMQVYDFTCICISLHACSCRFSVFLGSKPSDCVELDSWARIHLSFTLTYKIFTWPDILRSCTWDAMNSKGFEKQEFEGNESRDTKSGNENRRSKPPPRCKYLDMQVMWETMGMGYTDQESSASEAVNRASAPRCCVGFLRR